MSINYYVIDLETNGIKAGYHTTNEVSIIRCLDKVQLTEFIRCETPERSSWDAMAITKKTLADLDKGISKEEAVEKINKFLNEDGLTPAHRCFIGHNVSFDRRFIHALYESVGQKFESNLWLCTMALTKQYAKQIGLVKPKVNLHASCDMLEINKISTAHASKVDSRNTYLLYKKLVDEKKIDYLPFIKTAPHNFNSSNMSDDDDERLDASLLDI